MSRPDQSASTSAPPLEWRARIECFPPPARDAVLLGLERPRWTGFRFNRQRGDPEATRRDLICAGLTPEPIPFWESAAAVPPAQRERLLASNAYREQRIYIQSVSSLLPVAALQPQPADRILDLCAAPGSKTLQLAEIVGESGELAAVEHVRKRFYKLRDNLAAQGAVRVRTFLQDGARVGRYRPDYFDRVLVDAPCSGEGRFAHGDPASWATWSERKIREMQRKQRRLIAAGIAVLKPGGTLVYSTCTFAPEENEQIIVETLERRAGEVVVEPLPFEWPALAEPLSQWRGSDFTLAGASRRVWPDDWHEGFFLCRLRKAP